MSRCTFTDHEVKSMLTQKRRLGAFVNNLIDYYKKKESILTYVFVSDDYLLQMNQQYLQHDTYTDIITFDLTEKNAEFIVGDIYISIDRVKENALSMKTTMQTELLRVILHGALHISGFGDKTKSQQLEMRQLEDKWMKKYLTLNNK
jgi:probable rRNA maturation factor